MGAALGVLPAAAAVVPARLCGCSGQCLQPVGMDICPSVPWAGSWLGREELSHRVLPVRRGLLSLAASPAPFLPLSHGTWVTGHPRAPQGTPGQGEAAGRCCPWPAALQRLFLCRLSEHQPRVPSPVPTAHARILGRDFKGLDPGLVQIKVISGRVGVGQESTCRSVCHGHCAVPAPEAAPNELSPALPCSGCCSLAPPALPGLMGAADPSPADCRGFLWGAQVEAEKEENISCLVNPVLELELGSGRSLVSPQR